MSSELGRPVHADTGFLLLILSSPSGAGKTTLKDRILARHPELRFSVSHTTRKPRSNEVDGREYHFVDRTTFGDMQKAGAFAEWAEVHGNFYGTSLREIELARSTHRGVVFDIDHQGARQIKATLADAVGVFVLPPSMQELSRRLRSRASDDEDVVRKRLANARGEIAHYAFFDYIVVNDRLDNAVMTLDAILCAEQARRSRVAAVAEKLLTNGGAS
jgi:guanylate kinase